MGIARPAAPFRRRVGSVRKSQAFYRQKRKTAAQFFGSIGTVGAAPVPVLFLLQQLARGPQTLPRPRGAQKGRTRQMTRQPLSSPSHARPHRTRAARRARRRQRRLLCVALACFLACLVLAGTQVLPAFLASDLPARTTQSLVVNVAEGDTLGQLSAMAAQDSRIYTILQNPDAYPQALLEMLARDISLLDFVLGFPEKQGNVYADSIGSVQQGQFPLLLQWDERWGYGPYGDSFLAISGCAPTALAMVAAGLTGDASITPYVVAQYAQENGYYMPGQGTSWALMTEGCRQFGVQGEELPLSESAVMDALASGAPVICSMRPGDFTTTGHFIVLVGVEDGKIRVHDPNSTQRSNQLWSWETLEYQIKGLWVFHAL